ncbi:MAG TPA: TldD/PmbA family protein [Clostridia bacterium]|nr:TldD/PmbA family protein [Clostridia bacterium]
MDIPDAYFKTAESALQWAQSMGATMAEIYFGNGKQLSIEVRNGEVETMKLAEEKGLGVRVIVDEKMGFAFTTETGNDQLMNTVEKALENAAQSDRDKFYNLPSAVSGYKEFDLFDTNIGRASVEEKIAMARQMEKAAQSYDERVKIIESSTYQDAEEEVTVINNLGVAATTRTAYCGLYISLVASEGDENQTGFAVDYTLKYDSLKPTAIGEEAAERAVRMLHARTVPSGKMPVILEPYIATSFLGVIAPALSAEAVQKGRSLFRGKIDQKVASGLVRIIDDGAKSDGIATSPFDGEGVPTSRTVLIEDGVLKGYLYDTYTAAKDGVKSTGNGMRGSFKGVPGVSSTNFFIDTGKTEAGELIKGIERGLYITEVLGMHTANSISGDFSLGASGILIENGKLSYPVRSIAIAGNIAEMLKNIDGVGDDLRFYGSRGAPTLRVSEMAISGG